MTPVVINWDLIFSCLMIVIILSILLERILALVFESSIFIHLVEKQDDKWLSTKPLLASVLAVVTTSYCEIDLLQAIRNAPFAHPFGYIMTGLLIAGGSKGSIKLFRDLMGLQSNTFKQYQQRKKDQIFSSQIPERVLEASKNAKSCVR